MANYKRKKMWKTVGIIAGIVAALVLIASLATGALALRDRNPDNLIEVNDTYVKSGLRDYGLELDVADNGVITLKGDTSKSDEIVIQTLTLPAGTYTISGIEKPDMNNIVLKAMYGEEAAYAGLETDTFELTEETVVTIVLNVFENEDGISWANRIIKPVLVAGDEPGEFYK